MKNYPIFFKVLLIVFCFLGIMHIKIDDKRLNFSYSKTYSFFSKLGLGIVVILMIYNLESLSPSVRNIERFNQYTLLILAWIHLYVPTVSFFIIMCAYKSNEGLIVENLNRLVKFGSTFRRHLSSSKQEYLSIISIGLLLEVIVYNLAFFVPSFAFSQKEEIFNLHHIIYILFHNFRLLVFISVEIFHFVFLVLLTSGFSYADDHLKKSSILEDLGQIRVCLKMHQQLCDICRQINKSFSLQLLFLIGHHFLIVFFHIFGLYSEIVYKKQTELGISGLYVLVEISAKLYFYTFISNRVVNKVNKYLSFI